MKSELPKFPTMLRKMWSGTEVQQWLDANVAPLFEQAVGPGQPCSHKWGFEFSTHNHEPAKMVCVNCGFKPITHALNMASKPVDMEKSNATVTLHFESAEAATQWHAQVNGGIALRENVEPAKVPSDAAIEALAKQYDCHTSLGFKGFARSLLTKYSERVGKCSEHHAKCSEVIGYTAEDMADQGAQGFRDGYAAAFDEALKALETLYARAMAGRLQGDDLEPHDEMYNIGQLGQAHGISQAQTAIMALKSSRQQT